MNFKALSQATYSRQDLSDLLSLPVQRLPRYALLLGELRKKTEGVDPTHPDINHLDTAIQQIKKVTRQVNSAKVQKILYSDLKYEKDSNGEKICTFHKY